MTLADPAAVPGLPECRLPAADVREWPTTSPPAPWTCRVQAVLWLQYAPPPPFAFLHRPLPMASIALVHYLDTPVGGYHEILAAAVLAARPAPAVQVPFIAVDSPASVRGGRVNWALPKVLARFDGDAGAGSTDVTGADWSVRVAVGRAGPGVPVRLRLTSVGPLGRSVTHLRGTGRPVTLRSTVQGATIGRWLRGGRHLGLLLDGTADVGAPVPVDRVPVDRVPVDQAPVDQAPKRRWRAA